MLDQLKIRNKPLKALILSLLVITILLTSACKGVKDEFETQNNTLIFKNKPERVVILEASIAKTYILSGGSYIGITDDYLNYGLELNGATIVGSAHNPSAELIYSLNPDLVLYSSKKDSILPVIDILTNLKVRSYDCKMESFDDYLLLLKSFTTMLDREDLYELNGLNIKNQIDLIIDKAKTKTPKKVLFIRGMSNKYSFIGKDSFVVDMLNDLNAINVIDSYIYDQTQIDIWDESREDFNSINPDIVLYTTMGSNSTKAIEYLNTNLFDNSIFKNLNAYKNDKVYYIDNTLYNYKPNEKWALAYQNLFDILYGEE